MNGHAFTRPFLLVSHEQNRQDPPDTECVPIEGFPASFLRPSRRAAGKDGGYVQRAEWSLVFKFRGDGFVISLN